MNNLIKQENSIAVANTPFEKSLILNQTEQDLRNFIYYQVEIALFRLGISSKTEKEKKVIALAVASDIRRRFAYLTKKDIEYYFNKNNYGAEFSKTVCPYGLIKCIEDCSSEARQRENRGKIEMLHIPKIEQKTKSENRADAKRMLKKDYEEFLLSGNVWNLRDWNYLYITRILKIHHSLSEVKRLLKIARKKACENAVEKNKVYYRNINDVLRDADFLKSQKYKDSRRNEFRNLYVELFFLKVKQGKISEEVFNQ